MWDGYFINDGLSEAFSIYLNNKDNPESMQFNSFLSIIIRIFVLIYGEEIVLYYLTNKEEEFKYELSKYNISEQQIKILLEDINCYYNLNKEHPKEANPYFKHILTILIDMFLAKKERTIVKFEEEEKFLDLAYTSSTKNSYRISYIYLMGENPLYFEKYYYSKLNNIEVTREFGLSKTIIQDLNTFKVEEKKEDNKINKIASRLVIASIVMTIFSTIFILVVCL